MYKVVLSIIYHQLKIEKPTQIFELRWLSKIKFSALL